MNAGSREQAHGLNQIARAITQMEQAGQNMAATAEESAAAAEELTTQSSTLTDAAQQLRRLVDGSAVERSSGSNPRPHAPAPVGAHADNAALPLDHPSGEEAERVC